MKVVIFLGLAVLVGCSDRATTGDAKVTTDGTTATDAKTSVDGVGDGPVDAPTDSGQGEGTCGDCSGHSCCGSTCVNLNNDILNCGTCGNVCPEEKPYCDMGTCSMPPCSTGTTCDPGQTCCNDQCCAGGQLCCTIPGPVMSPTSCVDPINETCPMGCVMCVCLSMDTTIATPHGDLPVALISQGDLVYSIHRGAIRAVPVLRARCTEVPADHRVLRITLEGGRVFEVSAGHPTADGRTFGQLAAGDHLDDVGVTSVAAVPYHHGFTCDLLPASDTGAYFVAGVAIGSTMRQR